MGWFKKLKKKVTIKSALKGFKAIAPFIPGGALIGKGIDIAESTMKSVQKQLKSQPITVQQSLEPQTQTATQTQFETPDLSGSNQSKTLIYVGVALIAFFLLTKK